MTSFALPFVPASLARNTSHASQTPTRLFDLTKSPYIRVTESMLARGTLNMAVSTIAEFNATSGSSWNDPRCRLPIRTQSNVPVKSMLDYARRSYALPVLQSILDLTQTCRSIVSARQRLAVHSIYDDTVAVPWTAVLTAMQSALRILFQSSIEIAESHRSEVVDCIAYYCLKDALALTAGHPSDGHMNDNVLNTLCDGPDRKVRVNRLNQIRRDVRGIVSAVFPAGSIPGSQNETKMLVPSHPLATASAAATTTKSSLSPRKKHVRRTSADMDLTTDNSNGDTKEHPSSSSSSMDWIDAICEHKKSNVPTAANLLEFNIQQRASQLTSSDKLVYSAFSMVDTDNTKCSAIVRHWFGQHVARNLFASNNDRLVVSDEQAIADLMSGPSSVSIVERETEQKLCLLVDIRSFNIKCLRSHRPSSSQPSSSSSPSSSQGPVDMEMG